MSTSHASRLFPVRRPLALVLITLCALGWAVTAPRPAAAEEITELRIGRQLGLGYLQLYVMQELKLVEENAQKLGLPPLEVRYLPLGSPAALNEQILSGNIELASAGPPPFLVLWDRTRGNQDVRMLTALNMQPIVMTTTSPRIKSLKDITDEDRIAVPGVKTSMHSILIGLALEKMYGRGNYSRLDKNQVVLAHPEAVAALLSGHSEVVAHMSTVPFQNIELEDPRVHTALNSYDVTDGPSTVTLVWGAAKFREQNPKTYRAFLMAVDQATDFIAKNRSEAARIFIKIDNSKLSQEFVEKILADPQIIYTTKPIKMTVFADYMHRIGVLRNDPKDWRDLAFPELQQKGGS